MQSCIYCPNPWILSEDSLHWRHPFGSFDLYPLKIVNKFDFSTIFYDVFFSADNKHIIAFGPRLYNLLEFIESASFYVSNHKDGKLIECGTTRISNQGQLSMISIDLPQNIVPDFLHIQSKLGNFKGRISPNESNMLKERNILIGRNKNNEISWIVDWINYHAALYGIDAVIIFENTSTKYSVFDLYKELVNRVHIDKLVVIYWPFRFGSPSTGGATDYTREVRIAAKKKNGKGVPVTSFGNSAMMTVAYWKFCCSIANWVSSDIDELVVSKASEFDSGALFREAAILHPNQYLQLARNSVSPLPFNVPGNEVNSDFFYSGMVDESKKLSSKFIYTNKQQISPDAFVKGIHSIGGLEPVRSETFYQLDFAALSTFWRLNHKDVKKAQTFDPEKHHFDCNLFGAFERMSKIFPEYRYPVEEIMKNIQLVLSPFQKLTHAEAVKSAEETGQTDSGITVPQSVVNPGLKAQIRREYESLPGQLGLVPPTSAQECVVVTSIECLDRVLEYYGSAISGTGSIPEVVVFDANAEKLPQMREVLKNYPKFSDHVHGSNEAARLADQGCVVCCLSGDGLTPKNTILRVLRAASYARKAEVKYITADKNISTVIKAIRFKVPPLRRIPKRWFVEHIDPLTQVYSLLADDESRNTLLRLVKFRETLTLHGAPIAPYPQYMHPMVKPRLGDVVYEGGIANGSTTARILKGIGSNGHLLAFEPLESYLPALRERFKNAANVTLVAKALSDKEGTAHLKKAGVCSAVVNTENDNTISISLCSIDAYEEEYRTGCDFIKLNIEGAEMETLRGAMRTIRKHRPRLAISVYHKLDDLYAIPLAIAECGVRYRFYLGCHSLRGAETVLYATPEQ